MMFHDLVLLFLVIPAAALILWAHKKQNPSAFRFSSQELLVGLKDTIKARLARNLVWVRLAAITLIVLALARPQSPVAQSKIQTEGVDITLALDCSTSMLAEDFTLQGKRYSRIEVVKNVVRDFIKGRQNDRIALVAFAARAYTMCPLTLDYEWLFQNLSRIKTGMIEDGTAIGSGIASSLNRLRKSKAKSKIIILLTDGRNNVGNISPLTAAEAAKALKIKIYTIGAGAKGFVAYPVRDFFGNTAYEQIQIDIDEDTLTKIADITGAKYFRATDTQSLKKIYLEIDRLEKTPFKEKGYQEYNELFPVFLIPGIGLLILEIVLANTILRKIP